MKRNTPLHAPTRRRLPGRRTLAFGTAGLAAIALSVTTFVSWAPSAENSAAGGTRTSSESVVTATPEPSVATEAPATTSKAPGLANKPDTPLPPDHAKAKVKKFLDASVPADPAVPAPDAELKSAAAGAILEEVKNDRQELQANGWSRRGNATVETLTIISSDLAADPAVTVAHACVDSSKVVTLDSSKKPVGASGKSVQRALNIFTLHYISDDWKVVARSFPDSPDC